MLSIKKNKRMTRERSMWSEEREKKSDSRERRGNCLVLSRCSWYLTTLKKIKKQHMQFLVLFICCFIAKTASRNLRYCKNSKTVAWQHLINNFLSAVLDVKNSMIAPKKFLVLSRYWFATKTTLGRSEGGDEWDKEGGDDEASMVGLVKEILKEG